MDGPNRSFTNEHGQAFTPFGVTYYRPGTGWAPQVWKQFDPEATSRDFKIMKESGVNCARVFLSFGSFYMEPGKLMPDGLEKFDQFLAAAEAAGLYVHPTGPDHWEGTPDWAKADGIADEQVLSALEQFWRLFAERYRNRSVIFAYDLRNEPEVGWDTPALARKWNAWLERKYSSAEELKKAWRSGDETTFGKVAIPRPTEALGDKRLLDYQRFREDIAEEWTARQAKAIKDGDPKALVTVGLVQWSVPSLLPGIQHYAGFRPARIAPLVDFMEVHFYPLENGFYEYSPRDEPRNLAYLESVVRECAFPGKSLVIAEFGWYGGGKPTIDGGKHPFASEEAQARWCRQLVAVTKSYACGWLNWGFYDQPEAQDVSQLTGLFTATGKAKKWGDEFRRLVSEAPKQPTGTASRSFPLLDWDACLTSQKAQVDFREAFLKGFVPPASVR
ncbi:MAG TPA: beta-galactosidase [Verrucomicrobiae bacterium]|nr:beta-galactosidase [Verrucomicrobiae bacterium]